MTANQAKVPFASPAWVDIARGELEELVAEHGKDRESFSVCEAFADAPKDIADADGSPHGTSTSRVKAFASAPVG